MGNERQARADGVRELLALAWPFVLSNGLWTAQIVLDRILLSRAGGSAVGASMATAALFWTPITFLQNTANYATTFVAQYTGAGRPERVGPAVGQALYFSVAAGIGFLGLLLLAQPIIAWGGHLPELQHLELSYFRCLCFAALPILLTAAASSFFSGRGDSRTVLIINAFGLAVNAVLAYAWIFGRLGFSPWGIEGAGWATVVGSSASAGLAIALLFRRKYRRAFCTLAGRHFEHALFTRLMRFGIPNGLFVGLDTLAFTLFLMIVGRLGEAELDASSITFTLNMLAFLPAMGIAQAVAVLVGQRLGENQPDRAARVTWTGLRMAMLYMSSVAVLYVAGPKLLLLAFQSDVDPSRWREIEQIVPVLLRFVALYTLFDGMNLIFSFALRGAGDTRFVTLLGISLAWPVMLVPTWLSWYRGWGLYWPWGFATANVILLAFSLLLRFRQGKWRTMRVIEAVAPDMME